MKTKIDAQEECAFILDTLAGKLPLDAFNGDWACFARYADMQAHAACNAEFSEIGNVMQAASNRAARKVQA